MFLYYSTVICIIICQRGFLLRYNFLLLIFLPGILFMFESTSDLQNNQSIINAGAIHELIQFNVYRAIAEILNLSNVRAIYYAVDNSVYVTFIDGKRIRADYIIHYCSDDFPVTIGAIEFF